MIIAGYPTIGKTTLAKNNVDIIDLDTKYWNCFKPLKHNINTLWYISYGDLALDLSNQGYTVLISTNLDVLKYLITKTRDVGIIMYDSCLYKYVCDTAQARYNANPSNYTMTTIHYIQTAFNYMLRELTSFANRHNIQLELISSSDYNLLDIIKKFKKSI